MGCYYGVGFYITLVNAPIENKLDLPKIAHPQTNSSRVDSGLTEEEVALATSREGKSLSAEISWSGDGRFWVSPVKCHKGL